MTTKTTKSRARKPPKDRTAAAIALVAGAKQVDVAAQLGIAPDTLGRWMKDPEFIAQMDSISTAVQEQAIRNLKSWTTDAARVVHEILLNPKAASPTRLQAASILLKYGGIETRSTTVISGPDGGPIEIASAAKVAMEQALAEVSGEDLGIPDGIIDPS